MLFKSTQSLQKAQRRLKLTTKQASVGGGYYKGNRVGSMGWHTKHGGYIIDLRKVRTYVAPEATKFEKFKAFVARDIDSPKGPYEIQKEREKKGLWKVGDPEITTGERSWIGPVDGAKYLEIWKAMARGDPDKRATFASGSYMILPGDKPDVETRRQLSEAMEAENKEK